MQVYVIIASTCFGEQNSEFIDSTWKTKELAEQEVERLKSEKLNFVFPYEKYRIDAQTVRGY